MREQNEEEEVEFQQFLDLNSQKLNELLENNQNLRLKFPAQAQKYYPSQESIHGLLTQFSSKLELSEEEPIIVMNKLIASKFLIPLHKALEHPNVDINMSAIECYYSLIIEMNQEIQQAENNEKQQKKSSQTFAVYFRLNLWFIQNGLLQNLTKIIDRINEENIEQYQSCRKMLKILEHLIQLSNNAFQILVRDTQIILFLANRIMPNFKVSHRIIDDNKFIASDILLSLLQTPQVEEHLSATRQFFQASGIQVLVQTISSYQNKLPTEIDERQYLLNLFDCLNVLLVSIKATHIQFYQMKGCYLMISYICAKTEYAIPALKAVSNCLDPQQQEQILNMVCEQIINDGSLKYLCPILMGQGLKGKDQDEQEQINQHILKILYFLVLFSKGVAKDRIIYKFIEKRFGKLQRIFELLKQNQIENEQIDLQPEQYIQLVKEEGLGLLETCAKLICSLWENTAKVKERIIALFPLYSLRFSQFRVLLERNYKFIDEGKQKDYLARILANTVRQMQASIQ